MPTPHLRSYWARYVVGTIVVVCGWLFTTGFDHMEDRVRKNEANIEVIKACTTKMEKDLGELKVHYSLTVQEMKNDQREMKEDISKMADNVEDIKNFIMNHSNNGNERRTYGVPR